MIRVLGTRDGCNAFRRQQSVLYSVLNIYNWCIFHCNGLSNQCFFSISCKIHKSHCFLNCSFYVMVFTLSHCRINVLTSYVLSAYVSPGLCPQLLRHFSKFVACIYRFIYNAVFVLYHWSEKC